MWGVARVCTRFRQFPAMLEQAHLSVTGAKLGALDNASVGIAHLVLWTRAAPVSSRGKIGRAGRNGTFLVKLLATARCDCRSLFLLAEGIGGIFV